MKRFFSIITICMAIFSQTLSAQNAIFEKYADMDDDIEYVCVTSAMLKNLGKSSATINGIHIDGITDALKNVLIINSSKKTVVATMKADYDKLRSDESYEMMMDMKDGGSRVVTLCKVTSKNSELVMYIQSNKGNNAAKETTFIVLNGKFTEKQLRKLLSGGN